MSLLFTTIGGNIMKKKKEVYGVVAILVVILIAVKFLTSKGVYEKYEHANVSGMLIKSFQQSDDTCYYYMYDSDNEDCESIEDEILNFADITDKVLFFVDITDNKDNISAYDWSAHHAEYDIEIGVSNEDGTKNYHDGQSEDMYANTTETDIYGHPLKYEIVIADEKYLETNSNASLHHIYASLLTPMQDYEYMGPRSPFTIAKTPTYVEVTHGAVTDVFHGKDAVLEAIKE